MSLKGGGVRTKLGMEGVTDSIKGIMVLYLTINCWVQLPTPLLNPTHVEVSVQPQRMCCIPSPDLTLEGKGTDTNLQTGINCILRQELLQ